MIRNPLFLIKNYFWKPCVGKFYHYLLDESNRNWFSRQENEKR